MVMVVVFFTTIREVFLPDPMLRQPQSRALQLPFPLSQVLVAALGCAQVLMGLVRRSLVFLATPWAGLVAVLVRPVRSPVRLA
jgi:hypothetical protein